MNSCIKIAARYLRVNDTPCALLVGSETRLLAWIAEQLAELGYAVKLACSSAAAMNKLHGRLRSPSLVVLAQDRPGVLPADLPLQLQAISDDLPLISVAGSWCEGELRTGRPWSDVERIYWYNFSAWLRRRDGQTLSDYLSTHGRTISVAIDAVDYESAAALIESLSAEQCGGIWLPRFGPRPLLSSCDVGLWVGGQLDGRAASKLANFCAEMREQGAKTVALLDFPRHDELELAKQLGGAAVLAKPWSVDDLANQLHALAGNHGTTRQDSVAEEFKRAA